MNVAMAQLGKTRTTYAIRFSSARDRVSLGRGALGRNCFATDNERLMTPLPFEKAVARKFRVEKAPTLFAHRERPSPIAFTRLRALGTFRGATLATPPEEAFTFQIAVGAMPAGDIWIDGRHRKLPAAAPGDTFVFDLASYPTANLIPPFDFLRFYLPVSTMEQLTYERGLRRVGALRASSAGVQDPVLKGLAQSLLPALDNAPTCSTLFLDALALAFYAHVVSAYGNVAERSAAAQAGLAPWQLRRVDTYIESHLGRDPSLAELANECGLSPGYFARAFGASTGMSPHRWLMKRRIERAKRLLLAGSQGLAEIAAVCGFFDQSHLNRVFARFEGCAPGKWRRQRQS
jgi:AraC family transcriptional regulator